MNIITSCCQMALPSLERNERGGGGGSPVAVTCDYIFTRCRPVGAPRDCERDVYGVSSRMRFVRANRSIFNDIYFFSLPQT